ncbi:condensation domain-containing protein [Tengunoibacter tsumagoiensis]|uniref:Carrier domain-containing protein n=1 Tax=Tengunoibacter tsumagoiensis TaxID=2014871 RepID=A0A402A931_9CHLR|nr:condensation domain-containing protein [Tengunoibacter tsumagoiensis]GCE15660.1 hypothetical protein KTT_55190 [Tengunoibacter tsumagoiensis]
MSIREDLLKRREELSAGRQSLLQKRLKQSGASGPELRRYAHEGPTPLSFAQQRIWFLQQLEPESAAYNEIIAVRLRGTLQLPALLQATRTLISRHPMFSVRFFDREGEIFQQVAPLFASQISLPRYDFQHLSAHDCEQAVRQQMHDLAAQPFQLSQDVPWRGSLLHVQPGEHIAVFVMHYIIADGWSIHLFVRELATLYAAIVQKVANPLPDLPIGYTDFTLWQREVLQGPYFERLVTYWRHQLAAAPSLLTLPTDHPRLPLLEQRRQSHPVIISLTLLKALQTLAQQNDVTLFMILLAAFALVLARYSHQDDLVIGSPIAGRTQIELEPIIGRFVNMLALRIQFTKTMPLSLLLQTVRTTALAAYAHQDLPFEKLVEELRPPRSLSHSPLFQAVLALENVPQAQAQLLDLQISQLDSTVEQTKYELFLSLEARGEELQGRLDYNGSLWNPMSIEHLVEQWFHILTVLLETTALTIGELFASLPDGPWTEQTTPSVEVASPPQISRPATALEERLMQIWCEVLDLPHIGLYDDFFVSGGHSLLALRLISRIKTRLGYRIRLMTLFQGRTIAALAEELADQH